MQDATGDAKRLLDIQTEMESERAQPENWYRECARLIDPSQESFRTTRKDFGEITDLFDSTAPLALNRFQAWVEWALTPRNSQWHELAAPARTGALGESHDAQMFYENVTEVLFDYRYSGTSNFTLATGDSYRSLGVIGGAYLYIESDPEDVIKYMQVPASESWFTRDQWGQLTRFHRKYKIRNQSLADEFPDIPDDIAKKAAEHPMQFVDMLHCVELNTDRIEGRLDFRGMMLRSFHIMIEKKVIVRRGGYRSWPYIAGTWSVADNETYPRSPGLMALAAIRSANAMNRSTMAAANRSGEPPLLTADKDLQPPDLHPNAINPGYLSPDGRPLMLPFQQENNFQVSFEMIQEQRNVIEGFFLVDLFQILTEHPNMTATEVIERTQEKATLLAPAMGRLQGTILGSMIEREIDVHANAGTLPPMPPVIEQIGGVYEVEYTSPLARRVKEGSNGAAILRGMEGIKGFVDLGRPEALDNVNVDVATRLMLRSFGAPEEVLTDEDEMAETRAQREQRLEAERAAEGMPDAAKTVKDFADAAATAGLV